MTDEQQLKLQAFFDGQLPENEAREVAAWVARDREATALLGELRNTRKALANFEPGLKVPESREFYWSKIAREIERLEPAALPVAEPVSAFAWLRRWLMPAGAVATLAIVAGLAVIQLRGSRPDTIAATETTLTDYGTLTYHDYANATTLVWLDFPAEREFAKKSLH